MITYNHERFIAQAIESVLMQQTSFPVELVIGEDCSTDGTREIVKKFVAHYPDVIRPLLHEKNVGMHRNGDAVTKSCRGEYIACLEGDDYWTSPHKLQKQVDLLERDPECALSFHQVLGFDNDTGSEAFRYPPENYRLERTTIQHLFETNYIMTCSALLRREWLPVMGDEWKKLSLGDWPMFILIAEKGHILYLDECMANYRRHAGGVWSNKTHEDRLRATAPMWMFLSKGLQQERHRARAAQNAASDLLELCDVECQRGNIPDARRLYWQYARYARSSRTVLVHDVLQNGLRLPLFGWPKTITRVRAGYYRTRKVLGKLFRRNAS